MAEKLPVGAVTYRYEDPAGGYTDEVFVLGKVSTRVYPKPWLCEVPVVRHTLRATVLRYMGREVFWYEGGNNRFSRTPEDALKSYIYRKQRAVGFSRDRLERQEAMLAHAEAGTVDGADRYSFK